MLMVLFVFLMLFMLMFMTVVIKIIDIIVLYAPITVESATRRQPGSTYGHHSHKKPHNIFSCNTTEGIKLFTGNIRI